MIHRHYIYVIILIVTGLPSLSAQDISDGYVSRWSPFYHGVASGDPLDDSVILWTRVTPDADTTPESIEVQWEIALDPDMINVVQQGAVEAIPGKDYTVHVNVQGLEAQTTYYYHFQSGGRNSLVGRTRTLPGETATVDHLRFGVVVCSNLQAGYFNFYRWLTLQNDLDAIIHLGDYIYDFPSGVSADTSLLDSRPIFPDWEPINLEDYRLRYSSYKLDTNLIRMHQQYPLIAIWDDHEIANNAWVNGAATHDPETEGSWEIRKLSAIQARQEWLPLRKSAEGPEYRNFQFGDLADLLLLDTRHEARDSQLTSVLDTSLMNPGRTLLGPVQKQWFKDELINSDASWRIIGNQVLFSVIRSGWLTSLIPQFDYWQSESLFLDSWVGYPAEQAELMSFIAENQISNIVFATGDLHVSFAIEITREPNIVKLRDTLGRQNIPFYSPSPAYNPSTGSGTIGVEFMTPSVTAPNFDEQFDLLTAFFLTIFLRNDFFLPDNVTNTGNPNPHIRFADLVRHGGMILDIKKDSVQANWYYIPIDEPSDTAEFSRAFYTRSGENRLRESATESISKALQDIPAPMEPLITSASELKISKYLGDVHLYPNPFDDYLEVGFQVNESLDMEIQISNTQGNKVAEIPPDRYVPGHHQKTFHLSDLVPGIYFIQFHSGRIPVYSRKILKF